MYADMGNKDTSRLSKLVVGYNKTTNPTTRREENIGLPPSPYVFLIFK
jgi:hypothetical protein